MRRNNNLFLYKCIKRKEIENNYFKLIIKQARFLGY